MLIRRRKKEWVAVVVCSLLIKTSLGLHLFTPSFGTNFTYHDETVMFIPRDVKDVVAEVTLVNPMSRCPECIDACNIKDASLLEGKIVMFGSDICDEVESMVNIQRAGGLAAVRLAEYDNMLESNYNPQNVDIRVNTVCCHELDRMFSEVYGCTIESGLPISPNNLTAAVLLQPSDWKDTVRHPVSVVVFCVTVVVWFALSVGAGRSVWSKWLMLRSTPKMNGLRGQRTFFDVQTVATIFLLISTVLKTCEGITRVCLALNIATPFILSMIFWGVPFAATSCAFIQLILYWAEILKVSSGVMKQNVMVYRGRLRLLCGSLITLQVTYDFVVAFKLLGSSAFMFYWLHNLVFSGGSLLLCISLLVYGRKILVSLGGRGSTAEYNNNTTTTTANNNNNNSNNSSSNSNNNNNNNSRVLTVGVGPVSAAFTKMSTRLKKKKERANTGLFTPISATVSPTLTSVPIIGYENGGSISDADGVGSLSPVVHPSSSNSGFSDNISGSGGKSSGDGGRTLAIGSGGGGAGGGAAGGASGSTSFSTSTVSSGRGVKKKGRKKGKKTTASLRALTRLVLYVSAMLLLVTTAGICFTVLRTLNMPKDGWLATVCLEFLLFAAVTGVTLSALRPPVRKNSVTRSPPASSLSSLSSANPPKLVL